MNILVTGASGLIGAAIAEHLTRDGHSVLALKRGKNETLPRWDPESEKIELDGIPPLDAVIHLAGENVAGRWTAKLVSAESRTWNSGRASAWDR